jgi:hypothetical protein
VSLVLTFDITENTFQTVLQAAVLITTSGRPAAKVLTMFTFVCVLLLCLTVTYLGAALFMMCCCT